MSSLTPTNAGIIFFICGVIVNILFKGFETISFGEAESVGEFIIILILFVILLFLGGALILASHTIAFIIMCPFGIGGSTFKDIGYEFCSVSNPMIYIWIITIAGSFIAPVTVRMFVSDTGVPPIYRFFTSFFVHRTSLLNQAKRATAHKGAPTFNADAAGLGKKRSNPTNVYEEILHKEKVKEAIQEVEQSINNMRKQETELMKNRKERLRLEEEFAKKMREAEELKARLSELEKDK